MTESTLFIWVVFVLITLLALIYVSLEDEVSEYDFSCKSCGYEFDKEEVEVYLASEDDGLSFKFYDACDCPNCGCQNLLCRRLDKEETTE